MVILSAAEIATTGDSPRYRVRHRLTYPIQAAKIAGFSVLENRVNTSLFARI
jgi:hypothetical protein